MSRIPLLPESPEDPAIQALFERVRAALGPDAEIPNLYRTLAHAPAMFEAWLNFAWPLRLNAKTPRALRELMILRGAQISGADYEWVHHLPMAASAGVSPQQIDALKEWREATVFDARERAALRLADEATIGPGASADCIEELRRAGFDDPGIVELTLTASFYVCVSRILQSLAVPLEPSAEQAHSAA